MRLTLLAFFMALGLLAQPPAQDISGTWVAKMNTPMGEMEMVFVFRMDAAGKLTGSQRLPFGDAPIAEGQVTGDRFTFIVEQEFFGNISRRESTGKIVGDQLEIVPAMPGPPPGGPGGPGGNGPGRPPGAGAGPGGPPTGGPGGPGGGMRRMMMGPIVARRGTPAPSFRAEAIDYKALPKLTLPAVKAIAAPKGLSATPPMGWNSWNKFRANVTDKMVREMADAVVSTGMKDAGYIYINIDDGWQSKTRDAQGVLQANTSFPDMKSLAAYVHGKGLKLGIYSSPGPTTCGGFLGSYGHEEIDARTWATWGIDFLKYDWCSASRVWKDEDMQPVYLRMAEAIAKTGRPILYSLCQYGRAKVQDWGPQVAGNAWRTTFDIRDTWDSMAGIGFAQTDLAYASGPGRWNDPDMLEVGNGGMTNTEYRTHFSLWAMVAAPLLAGNDLRSMSPETAEILMNRDVIAVNQDKLGKGGVRQWQAGEMEAWVKPLEKGHYAVAVFNRSAAASKANLTWADLKLAGSKYDVRDLWLHKEQGAQKDIAAEIPSHGVLMLRLKPGR
jgi:alpha-galactosidase